MVRVPAEVHRRLVREASEQNAQGIVKPIYGLHNRTTTDGRTAGSLDQRGHGCRMSDTRAKKAASVPVHRAQHDCDGTAPLCKAVAIDAIVMIFREIHFLCGQPLWNHVSACGVLGAQA